MCFLEARVLGPVHHWLHPGFDAEKQQVASLSINAIIIIIIIIIIVIHQPTRTVVPCICCLKTNYNFTMLDSITLVILSDSVCGDRTT